MGRNSALRSSSPGVIQAIYDRRNRIRQKVCTVEGRDRDGKEWFYGRHIWEGTVLCAAAVPVSSKRSMIDEIASGKKCAQLKVGIAMVRSGSTAAIYGKEQCSAQQQSRCHPRDR